MDSAAQKFREEYFRICGIQVQEGNESDAMNKVSCIVHAEIRKGMSEATIAANKYLPILKAWQILMEFKTLSDIKKLSDINK
jgi:hypothetical protein